ncbi:MAG: hypothetical protein EZS28_033424 [Streblomastix strix]|uniref:Uncharacterized protein n=1 Tax=Streblomastix strix TaxID=222440 RepID=A0A5J4ULX8_9EUKA|nr:MAG: hypothetical protein EZS28_033424 [Streblomastix strix]
MSAVTDSPSTKSGADNTVVLLGAGGTKSISELGNGCIDDSNYTAVKKTGKILQMTEGYLRNGSEPDDISDNDDDYITRGYVERKYVGIRGDQQIIESKSFYDNVTAAGFIKQDGTNQEVLLANGSIMQLSEYVSAPTDLSNNLNKSCEETIDGTKTFSSNITALGFRKLD